MLSVRQKRFTLSCQYRYGLWCAVSCEHPWVRHVASFVNYYPYNERQRIRSYRKGARLLSCSFTVKHMSDFLKPSHCHFWGKPVYLATLREYALPPPPQTWRKSSRGGIRYCKGHRMKWTKKLKFSLYKWIRSIKVYCCDAVALLVRTWVYLWPWTN